MAEKKLNKIGKSYPRKEGRNKVLGKALYVDDLKMEQMLHGVTVRSTVARAKLSKIEFLPGVKWDEFVVVTAKDIPGKNYISLLLTDQPCLADGVVNHPEEPILLLAHKNKAEVIRARELVKITYEVLPPVFTIDDSLNKKHVIWGKDNTFKDFTIEKGNPDDGWDQAKWIVEGEYHTGAQEQLYIENNGMIGVASPDKGVTVWGSMQCPYYVHKSLVPIFDMAGERVRAIQTETGGGFGGKEEYPSILAAHVALLSWKAGGLPVKIMYDRIEDMVATTKRHPSRTKHRTAVSADGKILSWNIDFVLDGGAYCTLSPVVLSRGGIHAQGPYYCPNVFVRARAVATNSPPHGAFRGFGAPQSLFAVERHMDHIAKQIGMDPVTFRQVNFVRDGLTLSTGQVVKDGVDLNVLLKKAFKESKYHEKTAEYKKLNAKNPLLKRGIGFSVFMHGAGFTGSGEKYLASIAAVEATAEGRVRVLASSTEIGQGKNTVFAQIAAEELGINYELIDVVQPDTALVPNSGPTVASRTVMIVGKLVENACDNLRSILIQAGLLKEKYTEKEWIAACASYHQQFGHLKAFSQYKQPSSIIWDEIKYKGEAYATYAWAVYVADVSVDLVTYETKVEDFVAHQEIGRVVHPTLAEGQIEGGVAQAIGYALYEKIVWKDGRMANGQMTNYIMPTSMDVPPIRVFFDEKPAPFGPAGAKGIGELPMDGPAPAIMNAVENATDVRVDFIPMTPEDFMKAYQGANP